VQRSKQTVERKPNTSQGAALLFDNLVPMKVLLTLLKEWLQKDFSRHTIYKWVREGMPHEKIRGDLYFPPDEVALWLKRTS